MQVSQRSFRQPAADTNVAKGDGATMAGSKAATLEPLNESQQLRQSFKTLSQESFGPNSHTLTATDDQSKHTGLPLQHDQAMAPMNGALQYAMLKATMQQKPKPILRNNEFFNATGSTTPGGFLLSLEANQGKRRTKSATKHGKGRRGGNSQQPGSTKASLTRPLTGKIHPADIFRDNQNDPSAHLVNNLILNNPSGRNIKFNTATAPVQAMADMNNLPSSSQNSEMHRMSSNRQYQRANSRNNAGYMTVQNGSGTTGPPINGAQNEQISIKHVTPELAAQVVKHFVLPMFDTDYKKGLRRKYGRMQAATMGPSMAASRQAPMASVSGASDFNMGTVLGDLKLTEHLSNELEEVKNKFESMHEDLEKATLERDSYKKQFVLLNSKQLDQKKEIACLRSQLERQIKMNMGLELKLEQKIAQSEQLINISLVSEQMRKNFCDELRTQLARNEALCNSHFNVVMEQTIANHSIQFLQEQFTILHESIQNISSDKRLGDKMNRQIELLAETNQKLSDQVKEMREQQSKVIQERDSFRADTAELYKNKKQIEKQYAFDKTTSKDREVKLQKQLALMTKENNENCEEIINLQKTCKQLAMEKEKSKLRIQKLIQRKGKYDSGFKTCKNCSKEYNEKENFNWSCRMHQSDYGGEMWWCCGRQGKDQLGCKYSKHESKDDEDEDMANQHDDDKKTSSKYVRCACCKEIGHAIAECTRDPNIKTGAKVDQEFIRIQKMKDFRKLFADSVVQTTHMLKKSVMIPIKYDEEGNIEEVSHAYNPFMRGIMEFDDYNYSVHNPYVLVEDPKYAEDEPVAKSKAGGEDTTRLRAPPNPSVDQVDMTFSQKNVTCSVTDEYEHDLMTILPSEMQLEKIEEEKKRQIVEEEQAKEKARKEAEKQKRKDRKLGVQQEVDEPTQDGEGDDLSKRGSEKDEVEEEADEEDEFAFRVYFRKEEIQAATSAQDQDQFEWLVTQRSQAANETLTKFNIMDYTPGGLEDSLNEAAKKKKKVAMQKKKGNVIGFEDEDDDDKSNGFLTDFDKKKDAGDGISDAKIHELEKMDLQEEIKTLIKVRENTKSSNSSQSSVKKQRLRKKPGSRSNR